jgi:hypothetical protein
MNIFEQNAMQRQMDGILLAWGSFKVSVSQLIESYRSEIREGQLYGASIENPTDTSIVIQCPRGGAPKVPFSSLMITIQADMVSGRRFSIDCKVEQWRKAPVGSVQPHVEWKRSMTFDLDTDHGSLIFAKEKFTPAEAASKLLETLLIHK